MARGLAIGHQPGGMIAKLESATGYLQGQRAIAGAITPSRHGDAPLCGCLSQDGAGSPHGFKATGGWRFSDMIDGCQAEYVLVPEAMARLSPIPDQLTKDQAVMCPDIRSAGFACMKRRQVKIAHPSFRDDLAYNAHLPNMSEGGVRVELPPSIPVVSTLPRLGMRVIDQSGSVAEACAG